MPNRKNYDNAAVARLFAAQGGVATRAQLVGLGVPPSTIRHRTHGGDSWTAVLRGVCANRGQWLRTATETGRLWAALLYAGSGAVITGMAALRLHGIGCASRSPYGVEPVAAAEPSTGAINVLFPAARRRGSTGFVLVIRTRRLPEPVQIDGFRVAPVARAAVDACLGTRDVELVRGIVRELVGSGRCSPEELRGELEAHQKQRSAAMRTVLYELAEGISTRAEKQCLRRLVHVAAPRPLWNRRIIEQSTGRAALLPGALWPEHGVVLEVDTDPDPAARERAAARRRWMAHVLRLTVAQVTPTQVRERWEEVWGELSGLLNRPRTYRLPPGYVLA
jgi:hypothetical protein